MCSIKITAFPRGTYWDMCVVMRNEKSRDIIEVVKAYRYIGETHRIYIYPNSTGLLQWYLGNRMLFQFREVTLEDMVQIGRA